MSFHPHLAEAVIACSSGLRLEKELKAPTHEAWHLMLQMISQE